MTYFYRCFLAIALATCGCEPMLAQAPPLASDPSWLTPERKLVVPGQLKIYYDACTGQYFSVPFNTKAGLPLRHLRIPARRTVMLEIVRLNPTYFDRIEFSGTATTRFTAEQNVVRPGDVGAAEIPKDTETEHEVAAVRQPRNAVEQLEADFSDLQIRYARQSRRFTELEKLLADLNEFRRIQKTQSCLDPTEFSRKSSDLNSRIEKLLGTAATADSEAMTEAFTDAVAVFRSAIDAADASREMLKNELAAVPGGRPNDELVRLETLTFKLKDFSWKLASDRRRLERQTGEAALTRVENLASEFLRSQSRTETTFRLHPFQAPEDADEIRITATGIRATADPTNPSRERLLDFTIPVVGGFKVDFSLGAAYTALNDDAFVIKQANKLNAEGKEELNNGQPISTYTILRKPNRGSVILNTNAHAIWRLTPGLSGGFHLGLGVDFLNEQRVRYLAGGTVKFGGTLDNLMLNFGVAMGNVTRLTPDLKTDFVYNTQPTVSTYDQFDAGFYLGLNYVLGRNKTKKAAEPVVP